MSWRTVVITGIAKLDYNLGFMTVRKIDSVQKVHISEIRILIIESTSVSLTAALLCELTKSKVKIILCDAQHNPFSEVCAYYGSHDTSGKVRQQIQWNKHCRELVWAEIISEKIRKQRNHLQALNKNEAANLLNQYIEEIVPGDKTNREGHAAKVYFNALFGLDFTRSAETSINAELNYGYGILLSFFTREIACSGYITQLGLSHDNMFNQFNLASDLMEPFRIIVDRKVVSDNSVKFEHDEKMSMLDLFNSYVAIDGKRQIIGNAIGVYCRSVFDALNENDVSLIRFYSDEL